MSRKSVPVFVALTLLCIFGTTRSVEENGTTKHEETTLPSIIGETTQEVSTEGVDAGITTIVMTISEVTDAHTEAAGQEYAEEDQAVAEQLLVTESLIRVIPELRIGTDTPSDAAGQQLVEKDQAVAEQLIVTESLIQVEPPPKPQDVKTDSSESINKIRTLGGDLIVGGKPTTIDKHPYVVSVQFAINDTSCIHNCSGTLVKENWVLTAAHCIEKISPESLTVVAGESDIYLSGGKLEDYLQAIPADSIIVYDSRDNETGNTNKYNDIGLIKTKRPFKLSNKVALVHLATPNITQNRDATELTKSMVALGWGSTKMKSAPQSRTSQRLLYLDLPTITLKECKEKRESLYDHQMCTMYRAGGNDSCQCDSGGPLMWKREDGGYTQLALMSREDGCARPNEPAVNTRVDYFTTWIDSHINAVDQKSQGSAATTIHIPTKMFTMNLVSAAAVVFCHYIYSCY